MSAQSLLRRITTLVTFTILTLCSFSARADEKGGLLVEIQKKVAARNDLVQPNSGGSDYHPVDRTLSLKVSVKNTSMKAFAASTADYVVIMQRWGMAATTGGLESYTGSKPLEAMLPAHSQAIDLGEFHIGGYQYFTSASEQYVDRMVAWKVTIMRDGQKLEFKSGSSFDSLLKRAKPGR